jgi:hypothetical protein
VTLVEMAAANFTGWTTDEIFFRYLYEAAHVHWQELSQFELQLQKELYRVLIERQFIPGCSLVDSDMLSMAMALSRIDTVLEGDDLSRRADWLVCYLGDVRRECRIVAGVKI